MPTSNGIFYEQQSGGLCRMHSLNAFFGYSKISPRDFQEYISQYDKYLKKRFNITVSSSAFDLINSDQTNLVAWILKQHKVHVRYYALNTLHGKQLDPKIEKAPFVFVYNAGHIWGIRLHNGKHYKVDSMGGVQSYHISNLRGQRDIGIMVPVPLKYEWDKKVDKINEILDREGIKTKKQLGEYLKKLHKEGSVLGELEIPLGVAMSILETKMSKPPRREFQRITDLIYRYNSFISVFTDGNYNKIGLILKHVPDIIFELISLQ